MKRVIIKILRRVIGTKTASRLITKLAYIFGVNLYILALKKRGFLNYTDSQVSGEKYFIGDYLKRYFQGIETSDLILFDVGANIGDYTKELYGSFPKAGIYSFEPNPNSYSKLLEDSSEISEHRNIHFLSQGLSSTEQVMMMMTYSGDLSSQHASLHSEVLSDFHHSDDVAKVSASFTTLDSFCVKNNIQRINLLKIDTEGHELEVLKGAIDMINSGRIDIIQFEFGECHVYSRVFLKDFYNLLVGYKFYRLLPDQLLFLGDYTPANEVFQFQNIIAIR